MFRLGELYRLKAQDSLRKMQSSTAGVTTADQMMGELCHKQRIFPPWPLVPWLRSCWNNDQNFHPAKMLKWRFNFHSSNFDIFTEQMFLLFVFFSFKKYNQIIPIMTAALPLLLHAGIPIWAWQILWPLRHWCAETRSAEWWSPCHPDEHDVTRCTSMRTSLAPQCLWAAWRQCRWGGPHERSSSPWPWCGAHRHLVHPRCQ